MKRYLDDLLLKDLPRKMVLVTGPRQVGKTTLCRQLMMSFEPAQYLNWDVPGDRAVLLRQSWSPRARLLAFDEIHKMTDWKNWLKGVVDGRPPQQALLVTGGARMETCRQSGDSLAGRYLAYRLHPISVREWVEQQGGPADAALQHLLERGGFPEPCLTNDAVDVDRWRRQYFTDLIREDVLEFSRLQEINTMRLFVELLRERVGSPLSLASLARDLATAPNTLKRYLEILQALYIVFLVPPWHDNLARAIQRSPKIYFFDIGLVRGNEGARFENAVAAMLLKHSHYRQDALGRDCQLYYLRTKDGAEVDFALAEDNRLTHLIECKTSDPSIHRPLSAFHGRFPTAQATQLVRDLRQDEQRGPVHLVAAGPWLASLDA